MSSAGMRAAGGRPPLGLPTLAGAAAILMWGLLALLTVATAGLPPFQVTAITFALGGLLLTGLAAARGRLAGLVQPWPAALTGIAGLFGFHAAYFAALKLAPAAEASLVVYLWPLLIVIFSGLLPGERLSRRHLAGAALGLAGVAVLGLARGDLGFAAQHGTGYALALACAVIWAGYSVLSRRFSAVPSEAVAGNCLATAALAGLAHLAFETFVPPSGSGWLALAALGLGPVGAAFFLWDIGMKKGDIRFLGVAAYATPVVSTLALIAAGAAAPGLALGLACLLIVAGALVAR